MAVDALELQLTAAQQRLSALQRRASGGAADPKLLTRALRELETVIDELRAAQAQLVESRSRVAALHAELTRQSERYADLFDAIPTPCLVTRGDSSIVEANRAAAELLNVSQRFLVGKPLAIFVGQDRAGFLRVVESAAGGNATEVQMRLRPRERAPFDVSARVHTDGAFVRWVIERAGACAFAPAGHVGV